MKKLSVVIIARNEEANLPRCLGSVKWADEILVGDSGSTDRTVEIARSYGARIVTYEWTGFGPAKQIVSEQAEGEWILSLDADEEVTDKLAEEIKAAVGSDQGAVGYNIRRRTLFLGRWMYHGGWYPDWVTRLYRRESGRISGYAVHEGIAVDGPTARMNNDLLHYSYPTLEIYLQKLNRYTTLAAQEAIGRGQTASLWHIVVNPFAKFIKQYVLRAGFLDGTEGFVLAVLSAGYVVIKYTKLWQLQRRSTGTTD